MEGKEVYFKKNHSFGRKTQNVMRVKKQKETNGLSILGKKEADGLLRDV